MKIRRKWKLKHNRVSVLKVEIQSVNTQGATFGVKTKVHGRVRLSAGSWAGWVQWTWFGWHEGGQITAETLRWRCVHNFANHRGKNRMIKRHINNAVWKHARENSLIPA